MFGTLSSFDTSGALARCRHWLGARDSEKNKASSRPSGNMAGNLARQISIQIMETCMQNGTVAEEGVIVLSDGLVGKGTA